MGADALSDVLRAVKLTGAVFFTVDVSPPWLAQCRTPRHCGRSSCRRRSI